MKKLILLLSVVFLTTTALQAQDSKFYLGIGVGYATASGDLDGIESGVNLKFFDMGYRFNETWGVTAGLSSSGHTIENVDDVTVGVAHIGIGPMYTTTLGNASWDIKPQIAISYGMAFDGDGLMGDDIEASGSAFILGNSFVFGDGGQGFAWSIDVDYRMGKFTEETENGITYDWDDDNKLNNLTIGVGLRYNF
tara:strand:+ start:1464 stop:2045 length:582 start_codon:yes stop_codon:yes gene_type:complete